MLHLNSGPWDWKKNSYVTKIVLAQNREIVNVTIQVWWMYRYCELRKIFEKHKRSYQYYNATDNVSHFDQCISWCLHILHNTESINTYKNLLTPICMMLSLNDLLTDANKKIQSKTATSTWIHYYFFNLIRTHWTFIKTSRLSMKLIKWN